MLYHLRHMIKRCYKINWMRYDKEWVCPLVLVGDPTELQMILKVISPSLNNGILRPDTKEW